MATIEITENNFESTLQDNGIVLVDFWASWCGPCRAFAPVFENASERHPDITFGKVDTDKEQVLAGEFGIRSIPTLAIFRDGVLLFAQPGALPQSSLEDIIAKVRALDMDEVRARMAEREHEGRAGHDR